MNPKMLSSYASSASRAGFLNDACFLQNPPFKSTFPFSTSASIPSFPTDYLIKSWGFSPEIALSLTKNLNFKTPEKPDSVLAFLRNHGFLEADIREVIRKIPILLQSKIDVTLQPKIQFLLDLGLPASRISELVAANPSILQRSLKNQLKPSLDFFMDFVHTNENFISALNRCKWLLTYDINKTIIPNVSFLINHGIPKSNISKFIKSHPRNLMRKPVRFNEIVLKIEEMGFEPKSPTFIHDVRAVSSLSKSTLNSKFKAYKNLGWSEEEALGAFKRAPICILYSEEKIKRGMEFFVNKLGWKPSDLSLYPRLLMYSLETRIIPRCAVLKLLASKNLIRKNGKLIWVLSLNEKKFLDKFVTKFSEEVPEVLEAYQGKMNWVL